MKLKLALLAMGFGLLTGVAPMSAHHSFAGTYLEDAPPMTIEGELKAFLVRNPHSFVQVEVKDKSGATTRWAVEWGAGGQLGRQGVTRDTLKAGDHVIVVGNPGRTAEDHRLRMVNITRPAANGQPEFKWGGTFD